MIAKNNLSTISDKYKVIDSEKKQYDFCYRYPFGEHMVRIFGKKYVTSEIINDCRSLTTFVIDKFFKDGPTKDSLDIDIHMVNKLFERTGNFAEIDWLDRNIRPTYFEITIDTNQKHGIILNSLAHELVHVKQMAKGEWYPHLRNEMKIHTFKKKRYDSSKLDYWDLPWEIEAHGRAIGLVVQWVNAAKKHDKPWAKELDNLNL